MVDRYGLTPGYIWSELGLPLIQGLADYIPVLEAEDALRGVSVAHPTREGIDSWRDTIRQSQIVDAPTPRYSHTIEDQAARFAAIGIAVRVFA